MLRNAEKSRFHTDGPRKALRPELPHCRPLGCEKTDGSRNFSSGPGLPRRFASPFWLMLTNPAPGASRVGLLPPMENGVPEKAEKMPLTCQSFSTQPTGLVL